MPTYSLLSSNKKPRFLLSQLISLGFYLLVLVNHFLKRTRIFVDLFLDYTFIDSLHFSHCNSQYFLNFPQ
jgi:hypothetical protein